MNHASDRMRGALGKPTEEIADEWYETLLARATAHPGQVCTKHYGLHKAMSVVVPPIPTQRKAGSKS